MFRTHANHETPCDFMKLHSVSKILGGNIFLCSGYLPPLLVQLVERPLSVQKVPGSNPVATSYQGEKNGTSSSHFKWLC